MPRRSALVSSGVEESLGEKARLVPGPPEGPADLRDRALAGRKPGESKRVRRQEEWVVHREVVGCCAGRKPHLPRTVFGCSTTLFWLAVAILLGRRARPWRLRLSASVLNHRELSSRQRRCREAESRQTRGDTGIATCRPPCALGTFSRNRDSSVRAQSLWTARDKPALTGFLHVLDNINERLLLDGCSPSRISMLIRSACAL